MSREATVILTGGVRAKLVCIAGKPDGKRHGFNWKLWISQPWGLGMAMKWMCRENAISHHYWWMSIRKDWLAHAGCCSQRPSSQHALLPSCGIYPAKQAEKFPHLCKWWAGDSMFFQSYPPCWSMRKRGHGCGRGDPEWHPEEHCHVGQMCLIPLANICEMMEEECQHAQLSEYKQTVFNFFKSCLCCTIKTITATFVLWSRSISLLLGQDKLLVFLLLLKLPLSCMLLHIEDDFFFMPLSSSCVDVRIPLYIYIVQQHLCWIQLVFMVIFWYIAGMPLPSLLMTVPLCLTNK